MYGDPPRRAAAYGVRRRQRSVATQLRNATISPQTPICCVFHVTCHAGCKSQARAVPDDVRLTKMTPPRTESRAELVSRRRVSPSFLSIPPRRSLRNHSSSSPSAYQSARTASMTRFSNATPSALDKSNTGPGPLERGDDQPSHPSPRRPAHQCCSAGVQHARDSSSHTRESTADAAVATPHTGQGVLWKRGRGAVSRIPVCCCKGFQSEGGMLCSDFIMPRARVIADQSLRKWDG